MCSTCVRLGKECRKESKVEFRPVVMGQSTTLVNTNEHTSKRLASITSIESKSLPKSLSNNITNGITPKQSSAIQFYSSQWANQVDMLPLALQNLGQGALMDDLTTALSSCHLSRLTSQHKIHTTSSNELVYRPDMNHESVSYSFYNSALRRVAAWSPEKVRENQTALVLFCYLEASMGSFRGYGVHSNVVRNLLKSAELEEAWFEIEMQIWMRRVYFGTLDFHRSSGSFSSWKTQGKVHVMKILCESVRLNYAYLVAVFQGEDTDTYDAALREQAQELDGMARRFCFPAGKKAIRFPSHAEAMESAYYATARAMQATAPLTNLGPDKMQQAYEEAERWAMMLIRIVEGMSWKECARQNVFTVGVTSLLLSVVLRSHSRWIGRWIQSWLQDTLADNRTFEEGSFPVYQVLETVKMVSQERDKGKDVLGIFQTVDDGGGAGKMGSYQSQKITCLMIYARCRETGQLCIYLCN